MKKSKFTEAQIVFAIKQSEAGVAVAEIYRKMGVSDATFYNWKNKYGGLGVFELNFDSSRKRTVNSSRS